MTKKTKIIILSIYNNLIDRGAETFTKEIYKKHIIFNDTEKIIRFFGEVYEQNKLV